MERIKNKIMLSFSIFACVLILLFGICLVTYKDNSKTFFATIDSGSCSENITWEFNTTTKTLTISGTGAMPDFESVADNGNLAYRPDWEATYKNDIETVIFENGITTIGEYTFFDEDWDNVGELYPNLKVVILNGTITSIGSNAFAYCSNLERFNSNRQYECIIPNSVESIDYCAFYGLTALKYLTIGENAQSAGEGTFYGCYNLEQIYFDAKDYGHNAYNNYNNDFACAGGGVKNCKLIIGPSVQSFNGSIFTSSDDQTYCITEIEVINNEKYYSQNNAVIERNTVDDTGDKLILGCRNTIIPNNIKTIGNHAFFNCYGLCSITIPSSVQNIESEAFYCCNMLREVYNYSSISISAGVDTSDNGYIGAEATDVYNLDVNDPIPQSKIIEIDNIVYYKNSANNLTALAIEDRSVTSISFDENSKSIGNDAFRCCYSLLTIVVPSSITNISDHTFFYCDNIKEIWNESDEYLGGLDDGIDCSWYKYTNSTTPVGSAITSVEDLVGNNGQYVHYIREDVTPYAVALTCSDVVLEDKPFWTLSNSNHTATKIVANGCPYGELPQGANGEPIVWRDSSQKRVMATTIVDLEDDIALTGTYSTFPNTGVGIDIILPSAMILALSVAICVVAFGGKKRKIIIK